MIDVDTFEERAAIMEFDGGMTRFRAETEAARAQGYQRWEVLDEIRKRNSQGQRDSRSAVAGQLRSGAVSGVQPAPEEENRPMPKRYPET